MWLLLLKFPRFCQSAPSVCLQTTNKTSVVTDVVATTSKASELLPGPSSSSTSYSTNIIETPKTSRVNIKRKVDKCVSPKKQIEDQEAKKSRLDKELAEALIWLNTEGSQLGTDFDDFDDFEIQSKRTETVSIDTNTLITLPDQIGHVEISMRFNSNNMSIGELPNKVEENDKNVGTELSFPARAEVHFTVNY